MGCPWGNPECWGIDSGYGPHLPRPSGTGIFGIILRHVPLYSQRPLRESVPAAHGRDLLADAHFIAPFLSASHISSPLLEFPGITS